MFDLILFVIQITIIWLFLTIGGGIGFYILQIVIERFIQITLPILTELYIRIKYPNELE